MIICRLNGIFSFTKQNMRARKIGRTSESLRARGRHRACNLSRSDGRIKQKGSYQKSVFYTMHDSDTHVILQGLLRIMIPTRWILMSLRKAFEYISCEFSKIVKNTFFTEHPPCSQSNFWNIFWPSSYSEKMRWSRGWQNTFGRLLLVSIRVTYWVLTSSRKVSVNSHEICSNSAVLKKRLPFWEDNSRPPVSSWNISFWGDPGLRMDIYEFFKLISLFTKCENPGY